MLQRAWTSILTYDQSGAVDLEDEPWVCRGLRLVSKSGSFLFTDILREVPFDSQDEEHMRELALRAEAERRQKEAQRKKRKAKAKAAPKAN